MRQTIRVAIVLAALVALSVPIRAQTREGLMGDLLKDVAEVETKIVGLAKALPASAYAWTPGKGVRSTGEVFLHVAADNYFIPAAIGIPAPAETGITKEYKTAAAFEKKTMSREAIIAEVEKSFAFLKKSMMSVSDERMEAPLDFFGRKTTGRSAWVTTVTHLHEHLGQLIAYARSNNVTPPWSK
jgi:hypothetical protein